MRDVVLTFDDGPDPKRHHCLDKILDVLGHHEIKAEFYVVGNWAEQTVNRLKLIHQKGHIIQNHSWSHYDLALMEEPDIVSEIERTQEVVFEHTQTTPTRLRPPFGSTNSTVKKVAEKLNLKVQLWQMDLFPARIYDCSNKTNNPIVSLMHVDDEIANSLNDIIQNLAFNGYRIVDATKDLDI